MKTYEEALESALFTFYNYQPAGSARNIRQFVFLATHAVINSLKHEEYSELSDDEKFTIVTTVVYQTLSNLPALTFKNFDSFKDIGVLTEEEVIQDFEDIKEIALSNESDEAGSKPSPPPPPFDSGNYHPYGMDQGEPDGL